MNRFCHDFQGNPWQLEIELEPRDAVSGPAKFEIHVAEMILGTNDIGQRCVPHEPVSFELGDETDGYTADRFPDRYTGVHQCHCAGTNARHRGRSVRFHDFAADSNRIRKFAFGRDNRFDRTFGKCAVTDLTPARTAEPSGLPDAEWWKIVVEDKPF